MPRRRMQQLPMPWETAQSESTDEPAVELAPDRIRLLIDERVREATPTQLAKILDSVMRVTKRRNAGAR